MDKEALSPAERGKLAAAEMALQHVNDGMTLGLGSGSTAEWFVRVLATSGKSVRCAATSQRTTALATECGLNIEPLDAFADGLDLTIDGADEIDPQLRLIKGGGGCHLLEKIVAKASRDMIVIADDRKLVSTLGTFPLPLEVAQYGWQTTQRMVAALLDHADVAGRGIERRIKDGAPLITDSGNFILDCALERIGAPDALNAQLNTIPGVVEHGLFIGLASRAMIGRADGSAFEVLPQGSV